MPLLLDRPRQPIKPLHLPLGGSRHIGFEPLQRSAKLPLSPNKATLVALSMVATFVKSPALLFHGGGGLAQYSGPSVGLSQLLPYSLRLANSVGELGAQQLDRALPVLA